MKLVKTDLRGLNALQVINRARITLKAMRNNPLFPAPTPSMDEFETAIGELFASIRETSDGGSKLAFHTKQTRLEKVSTMLKSLAAYVSIVAQGDEAIVMRAGFEQRKSSHPINKLEATKSIVATTGTNWGTVRVKWKPVKGARMYKLCIAKGYASYDEPIRIIHTGKSTCLVEDLEPLEYHTFSVIAIGSRTTGPRSGVVSAVALGQKAA
jgi:hypothetical protein